MIKPFATNSARLTMLGPHGRDELAYVALLARLIESGVDSQWATDWVSLCLTESLVGEIPCHKAQ